MMTGASCGLYLEAFVGLDHLVLGCLGCTWIPIFVFWTTWSRFFSVGPLGPLVDVLFGDHLDPIFLGVFFVFPFLIPLFSSYRRLSRSQLDVRWSMLRKVFALCF